MKQKIRLDLRVGQLFPNLSRQKIQSYILQGKVLVNCQKVIKPGFLIDPLLKIELKQSKNIFVSRGGLKLQHVFALGWLSASGLTCADVGVATGGFTDCLLQYGAKKIYAIDVGYGQLAQNLRQNTKVVVMEKTNARTINSLPEKIDLVTIDVSFISLRIILPVVINWLKSNGKIIALFKPQFEAGRELASKGKGVIRKPEDRLKILGDFKKWFEKNCKSLSIKNITESPIKGPKGNVEFLLLIKK